MAAEPPVSGSTTPTLMGVPVAWLAPDAAALGRAAAEALPAAAALAAEPLGAPASLDAAGFDAAAAGALACTCGDGAPDGGGADEVEPPQAASADIAMSPMVTRRSLEEPNMRPS
jgi:hypothetical protein